MKLSRVGVDLAKTSINCTVLIVTARRSGSDACGALNGCRPCWTTQIQVARLAWRPAPGRITGRENCSREVTRCA